MLGFVRFLHTYKTALFAVVLSFGALNAHAVACQNGYKAQDNVFADMQNCGTNSASSYTAAGNGQDSSSISTGDGTWQVYYPGFRIKGRAYCSDSVPTTTAQQGTCGLMRRPMAENINANTPGTNCWCQATEYRNYSTAFSGWIAPFQKIYAKYVYFKDMGDSCADSCAMYCANVSNNMILDWSVDNFIDSTSLRATIYDSLLECAPNENKVIYKDKNDSGIWDIIDYQYYDNTTTVILKNDLAKNQFVFKGWCETETCNNPMTGGTIQNNWSGEKTLYAQWERTGCDTGFVAENNNGTITCTSQCADGFTEQTNPFDSRRNCTSGYSVTGNGSGYTQIRGGKHSTYPNPPLPAGEWEAYFSTFWVKGVAVCSTTAPTSTKSSMGTCQLFRRETADYVDTSNTGTYCWCRATGVKPFSSNWDKPYESIYAKYVYINNKSDCANWCASTCSEIGNSNNIIIDGSDNNVDSAGVRATIYDSVTQCRPTENNIEYYDDNNNLIETKAFYKTQPVDLRELPTKTGYNSVGWCEDNSGKCDNPLTGTQTGWNEDKQLYAKYSNKNYSVSYKCGGANGTDAAYTTKGINNNTDLFAYNTSYELKPGATICELNNFEFKGWNCTNGLNNTSGIWNIDNDSVCTAQWRKVGCANGETSTGTTDENGDIICCGTGYHAQNNSCTPDEHTITYNFNYTDRPVENTTFLTDANIVLTTPERSGYDFVGWCENSVSCTETISGWNAMQKLSDVVLYAQWHAKEYSVNYVLNGGINSSSNPDTYNISETPIVLNDATRVGYNFAGWFTSDDFAPEHALTQIDYIPEDGENSVSIYAKWTPKTFYVNYDCAGGTYKTNVESDHKSTFTYNSEYALKGISDVCNSKPGFSPLAWDCSGADYYTSETWTFVGNVSCIAQWEEKDFTIDYILDNGTNNLQNPTDYNVYDLPITLYSPTRNGYKFAGWFTSDSFEPENMISQITYVPQGNENSVSVYAKWAPVSYNIEYNLNGGAFVEGSTHPNTYDITSENITVATPVRIGYVFDGWYNNPDFNGNTVVNIPQGSTGNITLYAKWSVKNYTISCELNGGTSENCPETYNINSSVVLPTPTRDEYRFKGWYDNAEFEGNSITVLPDTPLSNDTLGNKILYAKWEKVEHYNITYQDGNGNSLTFDQIAVPDDDEVAILLPEVESPNGYDFDGWCDNENGCEYVINKTDDIDLPKEGQEPIVLYPVFSPTIYSIDYNINGGENNPENPATYTIESDNIVLQAPTPPANSVFENWYYESDFKPESRVATIATGSSGPKSLYARYIPTSCENGYYLTKGDDDYNMCKSCPSDFPVSVGATATDITNCYAQCPAISDVCPAHATCGYNNNFVHSTNNRDYYDARSGREHVSCEMSRTCNANYHENGDLCSPDSHNLSYSDNGVAITDFDSKYYTYEYGIVKDLPVIEKDGYTFNGWTTGNISSNYLTPTLQTQANWFTDVALNASWNAKRYNVNYNCGTADGKSVPYAGNVRQSVFIYDQSYNLPGGTSICQTPKYFSFAGWNCTDGLDGSVTSGTWKLASSSDCTAQWERTSCGSEETKYEELGYVMNCDSSACPEGTISQYNPFASRWENCENLGEKTGEVCPVNGTPRCLPDGTVATSAYTSNWNLYFHEWNYGFSRVYGTSYCLADDGVREGMPNNDDSGACATGLILRSEVDTNTAGNYCWCKVYAYEGDRSWTNTSTSGKYVPLSTKYINLGYVNNCSTGETCSGYCRDLNKNYPETLPQNWYATRTFEDVKALRRAVYKSVNTCVPVPYRIQYVRNYKDAGNSWGTYMSGDTPTVINLPSITRDGYVFKGWCDDMSLTTNCDMTTKVFPPHTTGDKVFYAKWETAETNIVSCSTGYQNIDNNCVPVEYSITYNLNEGVNNPDNPSVYTVETPTITLKAPSKPGYDFIGWYTTYYYPDWSKITSIPQGSSGDTTLYARFAAELICGEGEEKIYTNDGWACSPLTHTITYKNGDTSIGTDTYTTQDRVVLMSVNDVENIHHVGWSESRELTNPIKGWNPGEKNASLILYEVQELTYCDKDHYMDGMECKSCPKDFPNSDGDGGIETCYAICPDLQKVCPSNAKCVYDDNVKEDNRDYYKEDYAACKMTFDCEDHYTKVDEVCTPDSYSVKYYDDATEITDLIDNKFKTHDYGTTTTLPRGSDLANYTPRQYYDFNGWYATPEQNENSVDDIAGDEYKLENESFEFYGKWTPKTYDIYFKDFDGLDIAGFAPESYVYGKGVILSDKIPTKNRFEFIGWCDTQTPENTEGCTQTITIGENDTGTKTFFAQWKRTECEDGFSYTDTDENNEPVCVPNTYTITYINNHENTSDISQDSYKIGDTVVLPNISNEEGLIFIGWCIDTTDCENNTFAPGTEFYDWQGDKTLLAMKTNSKFQITTTSNTNSFEFTMSAAGVFYVDWGDGTVVKIDRTGNTTPTAYTHNYENAGIYTIGMGGEATEYNNEKDGESLSQFAVINFEPSAANILSVSGSLGQLFKTVDNGGTPETQPRFINTFKNCYNLTSIPSGLFNGISGPGVENMFMGTFAMEDLTRTSVLTTVPGGLFNGITGSPTADGMFRDTFAGTAITNIPGGLFNSITNSSKELFYGTFKNTNITSIPFGLFANITMGAPGMFEKTFYQCNNLTMIPENLFSGITGTPSESLFKQTFDGCSNVIGFSGNNGILTTNYIPENYMNNLSSENYTSGPMKDMFKDTQLAQQCPSGTLPNETPFEIDWNPYVSCAKCPGGICPVYIYYYEGNELIHTEEYTPGTVVGLHTLPNKESFGFAGWCTSQDFESCTSPLTETQTVWNSDINLYAKWSRTSCENGMYLQNENCSACPAYYPNSIGSTAQDISNCYAQCPAIEDNDSCPQGATCSYGQNIIDGKDYYNDSGRKPCQPMFICGDNYDNSGETCVPKRYNITYFDGDTDITDTQNLPKSYIYGVGVSSLREPTKQHYTFAGWTDSENNVVNEISANDSGNKTLYATWTPRTYTLTFESNTNQEYPSQSYTVDNYSNVVNVPVLPVAGDGRTVSGWYTNPDYTGTARSSFTADMVGIETLYANVSSESCGTGYTTQNSSLAVLDPTKVKNRAYKPLNNTSSAKRINHEFLPLITDIDENRGNWGLYITDTNTAIYGVASCNTYQGQTPDNVMKYSETQDSIDKQIDGANCWCHMEKYGDKNNPETASGTPWVFIKTYNNDNDCGNSCTKECTDLGNSTFLGQLFGRYSVCTLTEYDINYEYNGYGQWPVSAPRPDKYTVIYKTVNIPALINTDEHHTFAGWCDNPELTGDCPLTFSIPKGSTGTKTLYAKWNPETYNINYELDFTNLLNKDITNPNKGTYTYDDHMILQDLESDGFRFMGWYTDSAFTSPISEFDGDEYPNGITLYAKWKPATYTIRYFDNDGTSNIIPNTNYSLGDETALPQPEEREYYNFVGWCVDTQTCTETVSNINPTWARDIDLYAKWTPKTYSMKYNCGTIDIDNQTVEVPSIGNKDQTSEDITFGESYNIQDILAKEERCPIIPGFTFEWHCPCKDYEKPNSSEEPGGSGSGASGGSTPHCSGDNCALPTIWENPSAECIGTWTLKDYNVEYEMADNEIDPNGQKLSAAQNSSDNPTKYNATTNQILTDATRLHYTFDGWYEDANYSYNKKITKLAIQTLTWELLFDELLQNEVALNAFAATLGNKKLYAKWTADTYPVEYYYNNGEQIVGLNPNIHTFGVATTLPTEQQLSDNGIVIPYNDFIGWYDNPGYNGNPITRIESNEFTNDSFKFYGKWEPKTYDIEYFEKDGITPVDGMTPSAYTYGSQLEVPNQNPSDNEYFKFIGWCTDRELTENCATKQSISSADSGNKIFFAKWEQIKCYSWENASYDENSKLVCTTKTPTITYKNNDETEVSGIADHYKTYTAHSKTPMQLPDLGSNIPGYGFLGWCDGVRNCDNPVNTTQYDWEQDKILYATWGIKDYDVNYVVNGGTMPESGYSVSYNIDNLTLTLPTPTRIGYEFEGWCENENLTLRCKTGTKVLLGNTSGTKTLYAKWSQKPDYCESRHWLHLGNMAKACLSAKKVGTPAMAFRVKDSSEPYYLQMSTNPELKLNSNYDAKLRIRRGNTIYNVHDASVSEN